MRTSIFMCSAGGSSPLTRGKLHVLPQRRHARQLIPAHAGKTTRTRAKPSTSWAHPSSRGENPIFALILKCGCGSSPLTRGKLSEVQARPLVGRLIPDHTGKTGGRSCRLRPSTAHPRSRGENAVSAAYPASLTGSSQLTRGKLAGLRSHENLVGLIPAHAGKTSCLPPSFTLSLAHPRSRGEYYSPGASRFSLTGSSPLMRGKQPRTILGRRTERLIPTHAGKTGSRRASLATDRAHPRSRMVDPLSERTDTAE